MNIEKQYNGFVQIDTGIDKLNDGIILFYGFLFSD